MGYFTSSTRYSEPLGNENSSSPGTSVMFSTYTALAAFYLPHFIYSVCFTESITFIANNAPPFANCTAVCLFFVVDNTSLNLMSFCLHFCNSSIFSFGNLAPRYNFKKEILGSTAKKKLIYVGVFCFFNCSPREFIL